jgi:hypothetical protein
LFYLNRYIPKNYNIFQDIFHNIVHLIKIYLQNSSCIINTLIILYLYNKDNLHDNQHMFYSSKMYIMDILNQLNIIFCIKIYFLIQNMLNIHSAIPQSKIDKRENNLYTDLLKEKLFLCISLYTIEIENLYKK